MKRKNYTIFVGMKSSGFTLVEVVVALALVALISTALVSGLRFGQRSYEQMLRSGGASWDLFATQRLIRNLVESAYPQDRGRDAIAMSPGIEGDADKLAMTAPAPMALGGGGFYRYEVLLRPRGAKTDLIMRWARPTSGDAPAAGASLAEEILIENVDALELSYIAAPDPVSSQVAGWTDRWHGSRRLPAMVRMKVRFPTGDTRRWPDLVMVPRLTDDATCVFDPVSQDCRSRS